ncbi:MAG: ribosome maturation factor RimP [Candidatus Enteromonas sp.]
MNEIPNIKTLIEPVLSEKGYSLYDLKFRQGKEATLEIVVDRLEPIGLDDIVSLSEALSTVLDEADPIGVAYTLDVSSAGAEKTIALEALPSYVGHYVHLHLTHPVKGENILEGTLLEVGETTKLERKEKTRKIVETFPAGDIDSARLAIEF